MSLTLLHVGCGGKRRAQTTPGFQGDDWTEIRLDIDPAVQPDIIGTMTDMSAVADASCDAVFSSHNIEHLYAHEVPLALAEFRRVLRPTGFVVITCPDLQSICAEVAQDRLTEVAYQSPAGPITPHDMLFGFGKALARGQHYMAHRCGFTRSVLTQLLQGHGFPHTACMRRGAPHFDLWAVGASRAFDEAAIKNLAAQHLPR